MIASRAHRPIGWKARLIRGRRRGPAPLSRSPGRKARPRRPWASRGRGARVCAAREEAAPDPFGRIEAICDRAGTRSALGRLGPAELEGADWPKESSRPKAAQRPSTESGRIRIRRRRVREPRHRRPAGGARRPEAPLPRGGPRGDAAIEPANGAPKKGPIYRRASAGLGRLRREPDPCVRRRGGARTHPARGCMGPAGFGNAGSSP